MAHTGQALDPAADLTVYEVGGAVRDALLGFPSHDRDWVVVGADPARMIALGFKPVGRDFPVFLHPTTQEEYALARTERKTGPGYRGFAVHCAPNVTLAEDLQRRDLTINAMARARDGTIIDPWGGQRDLQQRILRHVSPAFVEDPVRILRVARLAARLADFTVAPATNELMQHMIAAGDLNDLVPERVWQELSRGLLTNHPARMITVLESCGALTQLLPALSPLWDAHTAHALDTAAAHQASLPVRFAVLLHALSPTAAQQTCQRLKAPAACHGALQCLLREHALLTQYASLDATAWLGLFTRCDALRNPTRIHDLLQTFAALQPISATQTDWITRALKAARAVAAGPIAAQCSAKLSPSERIQQIQSALHAARLQAIRHTDPKPSSG